MKGITRQNQRGLVVLSGDIKQIDMIAHVPIICEERKIPYVWIRHRRDLCNEQTGFHPKSIPACMLILKENLTQDMQTKYDKLVEKVVQLHQ